MDPFTQLEAYLEGTLNEGERAAFEQEMEKNPELAREVWLHRQLEISLGNREEIEVEEKWKQMVAAEMADETVDPGQAEPSASQGISRRWVFSLAAVILLLIVVGGWWYINQSHSPGELYAMHYLPYDGSGEVRSGDGVPSSEWAAAFDAYNAQKYPEAKTAFEAILALTPGNARAHFYLGICALESDELPQARAHFEAVLSANGNLYTDQATWYLGLTCLESGDQTCVKTQLQPLADREGKYQSVAKKVLKRVKWE